MALCKHVLKTCLDQVTLHIEDWSALHMGLAVRNSCMFSLLAALHCIQAHHGACLQGAWQAFP